MTGLNPQQIEATEALDGPVLVLAGAGAGKTRVLTHRIARLIETGRAFPGEILAVTFTNKAAKEMKERISRLLEGTGVDTREMWVSTFHSMGAKLLREYGYRIGLSSGFSIYDDSDQSALIKQVMEKLGVSDKVVSPKSVAYKLDQLKNEGVDPRSYQPIAKSFFESRVAPILKAYEEGLRQNNAVDFGDLLLRVYELFSSNEDLSDEFQDRYRYVLVDEYQDTNRIQYKLVRELTRKYRNLCVVGDEDQSIYKWRGANIRNILDFEKDFPEARVVKLEQNYRSTGAIIRAANRVIAHNTQRKEKTLFTENPEGDAVEVHHLGNDFDEARFVSRTIRKLFDEGFLAKEIALLYRTHAHSRLFEDAFRADRIHYRIFGGLKFYERAEIKDSLSYLRLFMNPRDDISLLRIINVPTRGIGRTTLDALRNFAGRERVSLLEAAGILARNQDEGACELAPAARKKLGAFLDLYARLAEKKEAYSPLEFYSLVLDETGYLKGLETENTVESKARLENLKELGTAISDFENRARSQGIEPTIDNFLEEVALLTDMDRAEEAENSVTMMTIHSAKGLEFPAVFVVGMEEDSFPSRRREESGGEEGLEEERRLCYVAMTRARKRLYLSRAKMRRVFGVTHVREASRFLSELPEEGVFVQDHARDVVPSLWGSGFRRWQQSSNDGFGAAGYGAADTGFSEAYGDGGDGFGGAFEGGAESRGAGATPIDGFGVGARVKHPDYGEGTVVKREGWSDSLKLSIRFNTAGVKKFLAKYAPLQKL